MARKHTIILAAGEPLVEPVRGKFPLGWVIESFLLDNQKDRSIFVVLDSKNLKIVNYVKDVYPNVTPILVDVDKQIAKYQAPYSILHSLFCGLEAAPESASGLEIALGDTLSRYDLPSEVEDCALVSHDYLSSERWCLVECDRRGNLKKIYDKIPFLDKNGKFAFIGYYYLSDVAFLRKILTALLRRKRENLSDIFAIYKRKHPIRCLETSLWIDFGHKAGMIKAQNHFFNSREFNRLYVDSTKGTIKKNSTNIQKLVDEFEWYKNIPKDLQVLFPRIINFSESIDSATIEMELYGYPPLSELLVLGDLRLEEWELILVKLFEIHRLLEQHKGRLDTSVLHELYINKTWRRLDDLKQQNPYWLDLWKCQTLIINGRSYKNIKYFEARLKDESVKLATNARITIMHGDYCFSNILFDPNTFLGRLIDPRGRLKNRTIYGDPRYDVAKLRHSIVGGYDFAVHGFFHLQESANVFVVTQNEHRDQKKLNEIFDCLTERFGYNVSEIKLIEALLFASMIPLHKDSVSRQKLFYLKAVKKLNECLGG
jgi:hypothetical protein